MNMFLSFLEQGIIYVPHAIGMYLALVILRIPFLALETAYVFGAIFSSIVPDYVGHYSLVVILIQMWVAGILLASVAICLRYFLNMSYLLISILLWGVFYGINQYLISGPHISILEKTELLFFKYSWTDYPQLLMIGLIVFILSFLFSIFLKTQIGKSCMFYGNNNIFFDHYKISSWYIQWIGLSFASTLCAYSGFLNAYNQGFANVFMSQGINMLGIIMLILGLAMIPKKYHLFMIFTGVSGYLFLQKILLFMKINSRYFLSIQALVIIVLMIFMKFYNKRGNHESMGL